MAGGLALEFVTSFSSVDGMPTTEAEIALVGRSNVGKSSLINALAQRQRRQRQLARISKTPGATRLINAFQLRSHQRRWLVDLPGYGFAKASKTEQRRWGSMIEDYLRERDSLLGVLHLIDGVIGPTKLDLRTVEWLDSIGLPTSYVATKTDKIRPSRKVKRQAELTGALGAQRCDILWVSTIDGVGITELRKKVKALLES